MKWYEKFSSSNMQRCRFTGSDLSGLLLKNNNVDRCDFSGSDFSSSRIQNSNLANNLFTKCSLKGIRFIDCQADRMTYEFLKNGKADLTGITLLDKLVDELA